MYLGYENCMYLYVEIKEREIVAKNRHRVQRGREREQELLNQRLSGDEIGNVTFMSSRLFVLDLRNTHTHTYTRTQANADSGTYII